MENGKFEYSVNKKLPIEEMAFDLLSYFRIRPIDKKFDLEITNCLIIDMLIDHKEKMQEIIDLELALIEAWDLPIPPSYGIEYRDRREKHNRLLELFDILNNRK